MLKSLAQSTAVRIFIGLIVIFFVFQNCSEELEFSSASLSSYEPGENENDSLQFNGEMTELNQNGQLSGEITVSNQAMSNVSTVILKFFSFYQGTKTFIGYYEIPVKQLLGNQGQCHAGCNCHCNDNSVTFPFLFLVPPEYRCHTILVFMEDPKTGGLIQIPARTGYLNMAAKDPKCENPPTPTPEPPKHIDPHVDIDHIYGAGRVVEIAGTCKTGAGDITFSGDLLPDTTLETTCNDGSFVHCAIAEKPFQENKIVATQTTEHGKKAKDKEKYLLHHPPIVDLSIDSIKIYGGGKKAKITGRCTDGAKVTLNIYNKDIATFTCDGGEYEYEGIKLVNVKKRYIFVTQVTSFGTTTKIWGDVDGKNTEIDCSIDELKSNELVCKNYAGTVSGSCHPGLPVTIMVDGKLQEIAYCDSSGGFQADNILLGELGADNDIKIMQVTPFGKECSDSKTITEF